MKKIEISLEEIADAVADRVRSQVLAMLNAAARPLGEPAGCMISLRNAGEKKIEVIKEIRAAYDLDLKEAKELVEKAPVILEYGASVDRAIWVQAQLEMVGAEVLVFEGPGQ
jgi:ribosomal protein L7/L12